MPTLDIPERQLLVDFVDDPNGFFWHHRILLHHVKDTLWIIATPDRSVQGLDVFRHRLIMLSRKSAFPADTVNAIYGCDLADFDQVTMVRLRAEAAAMAEIFGGGPASATCRCSCSGLACT